MDNFTFTPIPPPPRADSQENRDQDRFDFNLSRAAQAEQFKAWEKRMEQSSAIPLSPVISSTVNKPANSNKGTGVLAASPSSNQRFQMWLASTNAALVSPKPGSTHTIVDNSPFPTKAPAPRLPAQGAGKVAGPAGRPPQHQTTQLQVKQQKPPAAAWYVRTPVPAPKAGQQGVGGGGGGACDSDEDESSEGGSESEQEQEGESEGEGTEAGDGACDTSPSLVAPSASGTPANAGRGPRCHSPGSAMAMTNDCIKSLSRLRFNTTSSGDDAMQISPGPALQPQQSGYEPETPLLFNANMAPNSQPGAAKTPTLARVLHFEQNPDDDQQQQQQQQQDPKAEPATPALFGSSSLGGAAEGGPYGLTPIQDVIGMMRSPCHAEPMPMGLDD